MNTVPTRHHRGGEGALAAAATVALAALFVLFEGSFLWLAAVIVFLALLPLPIPPRKRGLDRAEAWRLGAAALMAVVAVLIWLT